MADGILLLVLFMASFARLSNMRLMLTQRSQSRRMESRFCTSSSIVESRYDFSGGNVAPTYDWQTIGLRRKGAARG
jgi:hypothetical protein